MNKALRTVEIPVQQRMAVPVEYALVDTMIQLLLDNPLLLLFLVAAIGYLLGHVSIAGSSLGVAAVLFVGLAFGAIHPDLKLPELIYQFGLIVFVYTIGVSSGRQFFSSFRRKGLRDNLFVVAMLLFAAGLTIAAGRLLRLGAALTAGLYTGSLTNTAALAAVLEYVQASPSAATAEQQAAPVVGFSIAYPMGVVGVILAIILMRRLWKLELTPEGADGGERRLDHETIVVTQPAAADIPLAALVAQQHWDVVFGRVKQHGQIAISTGKTRLALGDLAHVVGTRQELNRVATFLGTTASEQLELDRSAFDYRRIFVSNPKLAGSRLRDLNLPDRYGAFVTRVRRGDTEMLAHGDMVLELGDRVRVVAERKRMDAVSAFFGDSYRALSEIDILTFTLGLALGLLVGMIPIPLGGGIVIKLGMAGGPLVVSLVLGAVERTGPLVWNMPYSANLTLRQIGLILFLAGIGTRSGYAFVTTLLEGGGGAIFVAGTLITTTTAVLALWIGHRLFRMPPGVLLGVVAGLQTQPAVLGFALEQTKDDQPNIGYAAVYPIALISKIIIAQLLLTLLR